MKIGTLGFVGSGKTTLLASLTISLYQGDSSSDLALFSFEGLDTSRDLTEFASSLQEGRWPARTASSKVAEYSIRLRRKSTNTVFTLRLPELSGELLEEVWRTDHIPAALSFLTSYDAYLLLVDGTAEEGLDHRVAQHVHLLQGIKRAKGYAPSALAKEPLALVLTKWDAVPPDDQALGPEGYAREFTPLLHDFVVSNFAKHRVFAASAVGAVDAAGNPLLQRGRIAPRGIFPPVEWLADQVGGLPAAAKK